MDSVYLDSCVVIYLLEGPVAVHEAIRDRLAPGDGREPGVCISDLTRMECRVGPLKRQDPSLLADYDDFFSRVDVSRIPLTAEVFDLATRLRAEHGFRTPDALHLAAAIAHGCKEFWTNDRRLVAAGDRISVVVLP